MTAAGHTTLVSGLHPSRSSIVGNSWYSRSLGRNTYSFEDPKHERSPARIEGTTIADWIKENDPRSRVVSLARKDRSAIALGGHLADGAYWYDDGEFVTSTYYPPVPDWLEDFNDRDLPERWFGRTWTPLEVPLEALDAAGVLDVDEGLYDQDLPYALAGVDLTPDSSFFDRFGNTPLVDEFTLQAATAAVEGLGLGQGEGLDYLGLGLSATDLVGHRYGPNSPELADTLLRLDRELGLFLDFLDRAVGRDRVVLLLSSDHGVIEIPEIRSAVGLPAHRLDRDDFLCIQRVGIETGEIFGLEKIEWVEKGFYLDHEAIVEADLEVEDVEASVARRIETAPTSSASGHGRSWPPRATTRVTTIVGSTAIVSTR